MGWLELLPLLKRLLPLLTRVAPMLEGVVVARAANGKETADAIARVADGVKAEFATAAENHAALARTLADHADQVRSLSIDMQRLQGTGAEQTARLATVEAQVTALAKFVRTFAVVTILLLVVCAVLLVVLLARH